VVVGEAVVEGADVVAVDTVADGRLVAVDTVVDETDVVAVDTVVDEVPSPHAASSRAAPAIIAARRILGVIDHLVPVPVSVGRRRRRGSGPKSSSA
jgi:hypothetical protein